MFFTLDEVYTKHNLNKDGINKYVYLETFIVNLFNYNTCPLIHSYISDYNKLLWIGNFYKSIQIYDKMKEYYLMAIVFNCVEAMHNLGYYFETIEINFDKMKEYYLMAIEFNSVTSMHHLGSFYKKKKKYDKMKEYYLMAIELNCVASMHHLGCFYRNKKKYDKMKEYYLMAIELNSAASMHNLAYHFEKIEEDFDKMKEYYLMAIKFDFVASMHNLGSYYKNRHLYDEMKYYFIKAIKFVFMPTIKLCTNKKYFYCSTIKREIFKTRFDIYSIDENKNIICPILQDIITVCYEIKKCKHIFSRQILKCVKCPICRLEFI
jgi:tetratricopeptide (TPR) repeat protein